MGERISNVVFMGMGEPLANIGPVMQAVRILAAPWGGGISARRITISTVGLPSAIRRLAADLDLPVTLALSLHAPTDDLRRELIPVGGVRVDRRDPRRLPHLLREDETRDHARVHR
jgi:23S rRNA (adenine2503-C2)-methyltransferase